ncbi:hypothetical protein M8J77_014188 [Diaphorina citri]|nr:hypothetical protein M8J77_014188 [Diaphorina citri]
MPAEPTIKKQKNMKHVAILSASNPKQMITSILFLEELRKSFREVPAFNVFTKVSLDLWRHFRRNESSKLKINLGKSFIAPRRDNRMGICNLKFSNFPNP